MEPPAGAQRASDGRLRAGAPAVPFHLVLVEPEIPPNTGNIARLCGATGTRLHLVHPLGFRVDEKAVRRAGLDYWHLVDVTEHQSWQAWQATLRTDQPCYYFSATASRSFFDVSYEPGCCLVFGRESVGLPGALLDTVPPERVVGIPMPGAVRSLNVANAASLALYEALRQFWYPPQR